MNSKLLRFCTVLKSNCSKNIDAFSFPYSPIVKSICVILYKEGFIQSYTVCLDDKDVMKIKLFLRYTHNEIPLSNLKIVSKPSNKKYSTLKELKRLNVRLNLLILSTSRGMMTWEDCLKNNLGGAVLFYC